MLTPPLRCFRTFASLGGELLSGLWPEAEDKALRGRNLSAGFRTLYQVGEGHLAKGRPRSVPPTWVENQSGKSTVRTSTHTQHAKSPSDHTPPSGKASYKSFTSVAFPMGPLKTVHHLHKAFEPSYNPITNHRKRLSVFSGQVQPFEACM